MSGRELGLVREALAAVGTDLSYAYEDLVFLEHNGFLLQFGDKGHGMLIHLNAEANEDELAGAIALLQKKGAELGLPFRRGSYYRLTQVEDGNIQVEFC